jgi:hypothetical protein
MVRACCTSQACHSGYLESLLVNQNKEPQLGMGRNAALIALRGYNGASLEQKGQVEKARYVGEQELKLGADRGCAMTRLAAARKSRGQLMFLPEGRALWAALPVVA